MEIDTSMLGEIAAEAMERIAADFGDAATIRTVAIIAEIDVHDATHFYVASSDDRPWMQMAFLEQGIENIENRLAAQRREED